MFQLLPAMVWLCIQSGSKELIQVNKWAESHPEAGAVCVGADHREAVSRQVASTHRKGNEAGEVPGHKVLQREDGKDGKFIPIMVSLEASPPIRNNLLVIGRFKWREQMENYLNSS